MPRSTQLKNIGPDMAGQHLYVTCFCCQKDKIRQDHFARHFSSHINKLKVDTAQDFADKFDNFSVENDVVIYEDGVGDDRSYPVGACFECQKYISNPTPKTTMVFENHVCKDKKKAIVEKEAVAPSDFKTLWKNIGKEKMSENLRTTYDVLGTMPTISYSEKIQTLFGRTLSKKTESVSQSVPESGSGDAWFKTWVNKKLACFEAFGYDDDIEDTKQTIIDQCEMAETFEATKSKLREEIYMSVHKSMQDEHHQELEELRSQIAHLKKELTYACNVTKKSEPVYVPPLQMASIIQHY